jgi:Abortive infection alpha
MAKRVLRQASDSTTRQSLVSKALGPAAEDFGNEIRPIGKEVGALTLRATRALLKPVGGLVWGFEKVEEWITASVAPKIEKIPPECRIEPRLIVAGPVIDAMKYCGSEPHIRELFENLLVTSMDSRVASNSHPAFVEMVKQISPDEAKMIKYMARGYKEYQPIIEVYSTFERLEKNEDGTPVIGTYKTFGPYSRVAFYARCENLLHTPALLSNLARLEIIQIKFPESIDDDSLEDLLSDDVIQKFRREIDHEPILRGSLPPHS